MQIGIKPRWMSGRYLAAGKDRHTSRVGQTVKSGGSYPLRTGFDSRTRYYTNSNKYHQNQSITMKVEITPKIIEAFNQEGKPAIVTIGARGETFNKIAENVLAMKNGTSFLLDFEDGIFFYKESAQGFQVRQSGKYKISQAIIPNLALYIDRFIKSGKKTFRFEIGEFKEGRRKLTMVE